MKMSTERLQFIRMVLSYKNYMIELSMMSRDMGEKEVDWYKETEEFMLNHEYFDLLGFDSNKYTVEKIMDYRERAKMLSKVESKDLPNYEF